MDYVSRGYYGDSSLYSKLTHNQQSVFFGHAPRKVVQTAFGVRVYGLGFHVNFPLKALARRRH